jgi:hypothetical protein
VRLVRPVGDAVVAMKIVQVQARVVEVADQKAVAKQARLVERMNHEQLKYLAREENKEHDLAPKVQGAAVDARELVDYKKLYFK